MKKINQNQINKFLIIILFVLVSFMIHSRITEQKRVEYYICYERVTSMMQSIDPEVAKENCKNLVYERND